jgi:hypothetical protein
MKLDIPGRLPYSRLETSFVLPFPNLLSGLSVEKRGSSLENTYERN